MQKCRSELLPVRSGLKIIHHTKPMQCLTLQMEGYGQNLQSISHGIVGEELFRLINPSERIIPGSELRELNLWLPLVAWWCTIAIIDLTRWGLEGLISKRRQIWETMWRPRCGSEEEHPTPSIANSRRNCSKPISILASTTAVWFCKASDWARKVAVIVASMAERRASKEGFESIKMSIHGSSAGNI